MSQTDIHCAPMILPAIDSETYMDSGLDTMSSSAKKKPSRLRSKRTMLFKLLKRSPEVERTKFTADSLPCALKLDTEPFEYHEIQSSLETRNATSSYFDAPTEEINSNFTRVNELVSATPRAVGDSASENQSEFVVSNDRSDSSSPPRHVDAAVLASTTSYRDFKRVLDIPVISTLDPNLVSEDDRLEPIQAVVTEYSRTLNNAFFGQADEELSPTETNFEQVVGRREKLKRALRFMSKKKFV